MSFRALIRTALKRAPVSFRKDVVRAGLAVAEGLPGYYPYPNLKNTLLMLKRKGYSPKLAIDVGAFEGEWTTLWKELFPACEIVMIEPLKSKHEALGKLCSDHGQSVTLVTSVAAATDGAAVTFHEMEQGSSVYREQGARAAQRAEHETVTIDTIMKSSGAAGRLDMLKLDTQGYELEVLRGTARTLPETTFVLAEVSLIPINEGCPLINEFLDFMAARGFRVFDVCGQWRRPDHVLWQLDLLFVNVNSHFLPEPRLDGNAFSDWTFSNGEGE